MGRVHLPFYGKDLGSTIENAEKILEKIKTNRFDKTDLENFANELVNVADKIKTEIA